MPLAVLLAAAVLATPPIFEISFDPAARRAPATGRAILYLIRDGSKVDANASPADGPFWDDPQPMFGVNITGLAPGTPVLIDDHATAFPGPPSSLPPGRYRAQAVLDLHRDHSDWHREPGNLFSEPISFTINAADGPGRIPIKLTKTIEPRKLPDRPGVELFELRSTLLSDFAGRDITLRAGVILPTPYDPSRAYAAIYEVPGFGEDHEAAWEQFHPYRARLPANSPWLMLRQNAFYIILDPESGNGHTLFADSANNGPRGRALVEELIPALEARYKLTATPSARLLRGHSSGGWSTLWLAITYPDTFGACWSSSPDPVDFRRFQLPDIYTHGSMYFTPGIVDGPITDPYLQHIERVSKNVPIGIPWAPVDFGAEIASTRAGGKPTMSIRTENAIEEVLGPDNTSGQQWDSWMAVFGPRNERGNPAALYEPALGRIDHAIAEQYRAYDIAERLHADPGRIGLLFHQRIRLVVGDQDTYFLDEAVNLLKPEVEKLSFFHYPEGKNGSITIVPGLDHGTIFNSREIQAFPAEMADHLQRAGLITPSPDPTPPPDRDPAPSTPSGPARKPPR
ncbi:MAG: hypothetical protein IT436_11960 [Phycisphaerales bacterium]|nr:hypothetical protein [Phycisphaerales bacterium]